LAGTVYEFAIVPSGTTYGTTTSLISLPNPAATDGTVQLIATVVSPQPGLAVADGSVSYYYGNTLLGTAAVLGGTATISITGSSIAVADATFTVTAQYTPSPTSIFTASSGQASVTLAEPGVATTNGSNTFNGNQTVNGTVSATSFIGNGSGLTGVTAAGLAAGAMISESQVTNLVTDLLNLSNAAAAAVGTAETYANTNFLPLAGGTLTGPLTIGQNGTPISQYISVINDVGPLPALTRGECTTVTTAALSGFTPGSSDTIALGMPSSLTTNLGSGIFLIYQAWETSTSPSPTITIQICNPSSGRYKGGARGALRIDVFKH